MQVRRQPAPALIIVAALDTLTEFHSTLCAQIIQHIITATVKSLQCFDGNGPDKGHHLLIQQSKCFRLPRNILPIQFLIYKDAADTITGNCDCTLFLGGKEKSTLKEISEVLGKETIDLYNTSETRSNNNSYGLNYQKTGKELMSQDEIAVMDGAKCILQLRGVRPFLSNKYDITKHPKYRQLSDYDKRNAFDIEKYRQHKLVVKPDDTFDLYDMGEVEAD